MNDGSIGARSPLFQHGEIDRTTKKGAVVKETAGGKEGGTVCSRMSRLRGQPIE
ncbi:hypothetical protein WN55_09759 [Dufourea novaeangliae]|uniref:Uncharacterized protein n=1 Tax=Dufourea novaeangliae TaxID=178035 RepID=A0A154P1F3_DUFNO|nr:hypothetical protein WN55_09759 [Dufourea novaeangliae]